MKLKSTCKHCQSEFVPVRGSKGIYCSIQCAGKASKKRSIDEYDDRYKCVICFAKIGIGSSVAERLLKVDRSLMLKFMKNLGIVNQLPKEGSWRLYAQKTKNWWFRDSSEKSAIESAWMNEYKVKHPDWSSVVSRYQMMTSEEKKEHNRKTEQRIRSCPERLAKKKQQHADWKRRNPDKIKKYQRSPSAIILNRKYRKYPLNKIKSNLRKRMRDFLKMAKAEKMSVSGLIGCTSLEFKSYMEKQFKRGMTWDNYGTYWHVDHILPCAAFDHTNKKQVAQCWHYTNLRPLTASENIAKSDTIIDAQMSLLI